MFLLESLDIITKILIKKKPNKMLILHSLKYKFVFLNKINSFVENTFENKAQLFMEFESVLYVTE